MKLKNLLLLIITLLGTVLLAYPIGKLYSNIFNTTQGISSFIISSSWENTLNGFIPSFIFFATFLFTSFAHGRKYLWIIIFLIPAAIFELYFDASHIYFPIALGLFGWLLGWEMEKLLKKPKMPKV